MSLVTGCLSPAAEVEPALLICCLAKSFTQCPFLSACSVLPQAERAGEYQSSAQMVATAMRDQACYPVLHCCLVSPPVTHWATELSLGASARAWWDTSHSAHRRLSLELHSEQSWNRKPCLAQHSSTPATEGSSPGQHTVDRAGLL